ncbi:MULTISPECIES: phosphate acyltransferase PlsX [Halomonas]|uniref:Phosphate acyltransferase n=1 Tax=Halomonas halophila TaxID=29573 RepID=A0ABQ0U1A3_9GAMM|nr:MULTISPECIES: phosphate acyltransferase PlsX [Halomonas]MDR5889494.1 phosphate acyltransferase PlsX [Halomonas salina]RAH37058.1 phosphate acyltransferase PlsX [Halomonas sp. SL1]WJY06178.1 phosphate acyltransferase PlsX [Halomonas halophila]GEK72316.1 phosphate acyltransferase [Halomonas halophila]
MRIAVDAMGGDLGPRATVAGAASAVMADPELDIRLFGPAARLEEELRRLPRPLAAASSHLEIENAPGEIRQDQRPAEALRRGQGSSMAAMLACLARGEAQAGVSAGNTGALMALSRRALGTVAGVARPAISTAIPIDREGRCYLLDLGANVDVEAERLLDFALMGDVMARHVDGLARPRVALLNVGVEGTKGSASVQRADELLRERDDLDYVGFVEGDGIFAGEADVVVCDGFVGNAVLKASEGLAKMLVRRVQATFEAHWTSRLVGVLARPALGRLRRELDPVRYNGASLLGLNGIVIKSHGGADAAGFHYAVARAAQEVQHGLPERLADELGLRRSVVDSAAGGDRTDSGSRTSGVAATDSDSAGIRQQVQR